MSLELIVNKLEAVHESLVQNDKKAVRDEVTELNRHYQDYISEQKAVVKSLDGARRDESLDLDVDEDEQIRSIRASLQTAQLHRSAFVNFTQAYLTEPESIEEADDISEMVEAVKTSEQNLSKQIGEAKTLIADLDVPGRPTVSKIELPEERVPFGKPFTTEFRISNGGGTDLSGTTATIYASDEAICSDIHIGDLEENSKVEKTVDIRSPISGEQFLRIVTDADQSDQAESSLQVDAAPKVGYARQAIQTLRALRRVVDNSSSIDKLRETTMLTEIQTAIDAAKEAKQIAEQEEEDSDVEETARADRVNTKFQTAMEAVEEFEREYTLYKRDNEVPDDTNRAVARYTSVSLTYLGDGKRAGLKASGKAGTGEDDAEEVPLCDTDKFAVEGRRVHDKRFMTSGETLEIQIFVDKLHNVSEASVSDRFPAEWTLQSDGDAPNINEEQSTDKHTVVDLGTVDADKAGTSDGEFVYYLHPPEDVEDTGYYEFGPARARPTSEHETFRTFGGTENVIIAAEDF